MFRAHIPPLKVWLDLSIWTSQDPQFVEAEVISAASYPGEVLGFDVRVLTNGGLLHNVPLTSLFKSLPMPDTVLTLEQCYYFNSPTDSIEVSTFPFRRANKFRRDGSYEEEVEYLFSVEWPKGNQIAHLVQNDRHFMLWPTHKLMFDTPLKTLPAWQKDRGIRSL